MTESVLLNRTRELLKNDPRSLPELHTATGLPFYWLRMMRSSKDVEPSVIRTEKLYKALTGKDLVVE